MIERAQTAELNATGSVDPLIGRTINDRFKITALIAKGGMGRVYRAEQTPLGRICAVKVLNAKYSGDHDPEFQKRFFLEASVASKLKHPNTVTIFDYGKTDDGIYFMAMELLEGKTLHRALRESGPYSEEHAAHIGKQICRSVREAHRLGVIHRDLKPANIFLVEAGDEPDFVKVLDFGLVKEVNDSRGEDLTETGLFMGSPKYMAPEQIQGDRVDARADIYSLGIILYEMLTGRVPFDRSSSVNTLMAHVQEQVPPLRTMNPAIEVGPVMEETVMRCLAKDAAQRPGSMDEVLLALKRVASADERGADVTLSAAPVPGGVITASGSHRKPRTLLELASLTPTPSLDAGSSTFAPLRPRSTLPFAIAGFGVALLCAAVFAALRSPAPVPVSNTQPVASVDVRPPVPSAPAPPAPRIVRVASEPEGAAVREGGVELCASTPCDLTFRPEPSGRDAEGAHVIVLSKGGFKSETREIKPGDTSLTVKLARERVFVPRPPPPPPPPPRRVVVEDPTPKGFKEIPY